MPEIRGTIDQSLSEPLFDRKYRTLIPTREARLNSSAVGRGGESQNKYIFQIFNSCVERAPELEFLQISNIHP